MNAGNSTPVNVLLFLRQRLSSPGATVVALASGMFFAGVVSTAYGQWPPDVTYPEPLNTNAASDTGVDWDPQLTTDGAGNWVAVWESQDDLDGTIGTDPDILFARSADNGVSWSVPEALNTNAASDWGADELPQLTTDGAGNWVAVWYSNDDLSGTIGGDGDILFSRSVDSGASWSATAALNTNASSDSGGDGDPEVTIDGQGNFVAVWDSSENLGGTIGTDHDILFSRSIDNGLSWSAPAALNTNASSDSGTDASPQLTTDGAGNCVALWWSTDTLGGGIGSDVDILSSRSIDNGVSWSAPAALNTNAASDSGNDYRPQLNTDGVENWVAVWYSYDDLGGTIGTDADVLFTRSIDNGVSWSATAALNTNATSDTGYDHYPEITTDGAGNWVAVWFSNENLGETIGTDEDILFSRSIDNGVSWSAPAALNTNAASDSGSDVAPRLTTDGAGNWVAVWESQDDLGGTIGTEYDILVARFQLGPSVLYVDAGATGPTHDGSSWCEAYLTLQDALDAATSGTTIKVADGTYMPDQGAGQTPGDRYATFQLINGVTIEGGYAGCGATDPDERDIELYETILSGDLNGDDAPIGCTLDSPDCDSSGGRCIDGFCIIKQNNTENSYHVVTGSGTDATAVLDGLTITAGKAAGTFPDDRGAGLYNVSGSPTLTNCTFSGNSADYGGGMYNTSNSSPAVTNCTLRGNSAPGDGGGMSNWLDSNPTVTNCTFSNNWSHYGGGMFNISSSPTVTNSAFSANVSNEWGGGMRNDLSSPTVINCTFSGSSALHYGGGMSNSNSSSPTVTNCTFTGCSTDNYGGGMSNYNSSPTVINCTFSGNSANRDGGGMHNENGDPTVTNCTFSGNSADRYGGGMSNWLDSNPTVANCILWSNVDDADSGNPHMDESAQIHTDSGTPVVDYSIVQGGWSGAGGTGVISDNPLFAHDPDNDGDGWGDDPATPGIDEGANDDYGDLHLLPGSPCIDAADSTAVPADTADLDDDGNKSERTPYDLDGLPRVIDDPDTIDTGVPGSPVVDMGAYEYYADCNRNGLPDVCDLDCDALSGTCDLPGCGESVDVDPADGIPDECVEFTGGCAPDVDWSCYDNWDIPGDVYPDNAPEDTYSVTLDDPTDDVFLDVTVTIDTLTILNGATLNVTQSGVGDLTIVKEGGIEAEGTIYVDLDRAISVTTGPLTLGSGGLYQADPDSPGSGCDSRVSVSASLSTDSITIGQGDIAGPAAGTMILEDSMSATTANDFVLDGRGAISCEDVNPRGSSDTPPILRVRDTSSVSVQGDMCVWGSVDVVYDSTVPLQLGGNFDNQSLYPECFDWSSGGMLLGGGASRSSQEAQVIEVAGRDLGASFAGFGTEDDTNFAVGTIEIATGGAVTFVNRFPNTDGTGMEALYVHQLILRAGSHVTLDDCRVYYEELTDNGAVVIPENGLVAICDGSFLGAPTAEPDGVDKNRYISFVPGNPGMQTALRVTLTTLPSEFSTYEDTQVWVGEPVEICENSGQSTPPPEGCGPAWVPGGPALTMWSANLKATQYCHDFGLVGLLHVTDCEIVPGATYNVQAIDCDCNPGNEANYSEPLTINTSMWGDICNTYDGTHWTAPNGTIDVTLDVTACLEKFKNSFGAPIKARADVDPNTVDWKVNISTDVTQILDAFKGQPYPFAGPGTCPP